LKDDPDYSSPIEGLDYDGRYNIRADFKGSDSESSDKTDKTGRLLFNAHIDTVPASEGMSEPYSGRIKDGVLYGRGACDDKWGIASIYILFKVIEQLGIKPGGRLMANIVVEEENGGNGSLAQIREGERADGCIVMEPTEGKILTSIRGAIWFKIQFTGKAGHSGQAGSTQSALTMARQAMDALEGYHENLLSESKGIKFFDDYQNPMPLTFGRLQAGNWPAAAPNYAVLEGVLGFLPNKTKEQVCDEFRDVLLNECDSLNENNFQIEFTYKHDCSVTDPEGKLPVSLLNACKQVGVKSRLDAMPASCDAWFYNNQLKIPTVVYGPGTLSVAHSKDEHIRINDIIECVKVMTRTVINFCGVDNEGIG
jgi:acetylornithine deacetylase